VLVIGTSNSALRVILKGAQTVATDCQPTGPAWRISKTGNSAEPGLQPIVGLRTVSNRCPAIAKRNILVRLLLDGVDTLLIGSPKVCNLRREAPIGSSAQHIVQ
jgi:hypothetical protein